MKKNVFYLFKKNPQNIDSHFISKQNRQLYIVINDAQIIVVFSNRNPDFIQKNTRFVFRESRRLQTINEEKLMKKNSKNSKNSRNNFRINFRNNLSQNQSNIQYNNKHKFYSANQANFYQKYYFY